MLSTGCLFLPPAKNQKFLRINIISESAVGLAHTAPPTSTNFLLTFLLTRFQEALYEDLPVYTEVNATTLIEECAFIIGYSCTVWTKMRSLAGSLPDAVQISGRMVSSGINVVAFSTLGENPSEEVDDYDNYYN